MTRRLRDVATRYGSFAGVYRRYWAPLMVELSRPLLRAVPPKRGADVLDLGAGVGVIATQIARRTRRPVICLDLSHGMLAHARSSMLERAVADIERIPLRPHAVDLVVSTFVLQHVPRPGAVFKDARRVLRPGGTFATATWSAETEEAGGPYDVATRELDRAGADPDPMAIRTWHHLVDSPEKMRRHARAAGFDEVDAWTEEGSYTWTPQTFLGWMSTQGPFYRRLQSLDEQARARALDRITKGIARLRPEAFVWRPAIVYCTARR